MSEIERLIFDLMGTLTVQDRAILSLRYYNKMSFNQIAYVWEVGYCRAVLYWFRARYALRKQLSVKGFGRGSSVFVIWLFGEITLR
jgi:hypothetical protein